MTRKRYCDIRATSLEDILTTCERHIGNVAKCEADFADCADGTDTDTYYLNQIRETWADLRDDVMDMLKKKP